jgi:hypothetical protein
MTLFHTVPLASGLVLAFPWSGPSATGQSPSRQDDDPANAGDSRPGPRYS